MLNVRSFPQDMSTLSVDKHNLSKCLVSGLFEEFADVAGVKRRFLTYLCPDLPYAQRCLILVPPSGTTAEAFLENSFWMDFAEKEKIFLFVLDPQGKAWNKDGSDADYVNRVFMTTQARNYYIVIQDNVYAMAFGDGADIAQQAVMKMTSEWSALATFGALTPEALRNAAVTASKENTGKTELSVAAQKAPLPIWMLWPEKNEEVLAYWMEQNNSEKVKYSSGSADEIYFPHHVWKKSTVNAEPAAEIRLTNGWNGEVTLALVEEVWGFIRQFGRHRGFGGKDLRRVKDPLEFGAQRRTMEVDGYTRIWYEYVPQRVKELNRPVPLVVVSHGRGGSAESFFELSGMSQVAEERDFIAIFPEAGVYHQKKTGPRNVLLWNGELMGEPINDVKFICSVIEDVESRYPVDKERVYACGQSSGGMMTAKLAESRPDLFAAVAPWSALRDPDHDIPVPTAIDPPVPYLFMMGESDWLCADREHGELEYHVTAQIAEYLRNLIKLYDLCETPRTYVCGEISYYEYLNKKGVPMLIVGTVRDMSHANFPRESWISYDQFLAKFSKKSDGTLLYMNGEAY